MDGMSTEAKVYLGLGSNVGDRERHLREAVAALDRDPEVRVANVSSLYETEPLVAGQRSHFNAVVEIHTTRRPHRLLELCQSIEDEHGRLRGEHWGPRPLDIDILLYDELTVEEPGLIIPHPLMWRREFVCTPLREIAPELVEGKEPCDEGRVIRKLE